MFSALVTLQANSKTMYTKAKVTANPMLATEERGPLDIATTRGLPGRARRYLNAAGCCPLGFRAVSPQQMQPFPPPGRDSMHAPNQHLSDQPCQSPSELCRLGLYPSAHEIRPGRLPGQRHSSAYLAPGSKMRGKRALQSRTDPFLYLGCIPTSTQLAYTHRWVIRYWVPSNAGAMGTCVATRRHCSSDGPYMKAASFSPNVSNERSPR